MIRRQWFTLTWALFILILTGIPGDQIPRIPTFLEWLSPDKIAHLIMFGVLSYLILYGNRQQYIKSRNRSYYIVVAVLISAAYGTVTELLQYYVFIGRNANVFDGAANILGAAGGGLVYFLQFNKNKSENKSV
ncbi:MAG TPA: VanZ family protein [Bacteroidetes bacterium]|nr:MAG: hypothetical protein DRI72_03385 [Bacteroidota bacterium]RLD72874.1 MAG: hypothetical protein DRI87_05185 [Bacteroidota bacterium]RLD87347.1 MAG: hypothetical protein DRJ02_06585 [Bacteroidota bacterium]HHL57919.1 VanZ family protein [Bacteroidota bacterium]